MTATTQHKLTFDEFLQQYPDGRGIFELVDGEVVEMRATREHKDLARFTIRSFEREIDRLDLSLIADKDIVIQTIKSDGQVQGRNPDVSVVDRVTWKARPKDYAAMTDPIALAVEVVSTNWEDDYIAKFDEYQRLGIPEYWVVDYLAIAPTRYLGNPKSPTVFVHLLNDAGQYQSKSFTGSEPIISRLFPDLALTVEQLAIAAKQF
jgi:Uma2 family endonuclease